MVDDIFEDAERRMQKAVEILKQDLSSIRTGRASSALVERITVDYYGAPTPINQVASISVPEARLLVIQPWDRKLLIDIEKAIQKSDLGINPNNDGQVIRLAIPPLNEERRREMVKTLHKKLDEHKVAIRNIRRDVHDKLRDREKEKVQSQSVATNQQPLNQTPYTMRHLAIIMDGNGRWATKRHLPRLAGHKAGVNALRRVLEYAVDEHIEMLSVYAFSTENWGRPRFEVDGLMRLFWETIRSEIGR